MLFRSAGSAAHLLPTALLACCTRTASPVYGYMREDGTCEYLSPADLARCFSGAVSLMRASAAATLRVFSPDVAQRCRARASCERALGKHLAGAQDCVGRADPFEPIDLGEWGVRGLGSMLCALCFEMVKDREAREREALWKGLPELVGVAVADWCCRAEV